MNLPKYVTSALAALALVAFPGAAQAGTYTYVANPSAGLVAADGWTYSAPHTEIYWGADGCYARSGYTAYTGLDCSFEWRPPANIDPNAGYASGQIRGAYNASYKYKGQTTVNGYNNPLVTGDYDAMDSGWDFTHSFNDLFPNPDGYVRMRFYATQTVTPAWDPKTTYMKLTAFQVSLVDESIPAAPTRTFDSSKWYSGPQCLDASSSDTGSGLVKLELREGSTLLSASSFGDATSAHPTSQVMSATKSLCTGELSSGTHNVTVRATDKSGNTASSAIFDVKVDTTKPVVGALALGDAAADGASTGTYAPLLSAVVTDEHSGVKSVTATIDGAATPSAPIVSTRTDAAAGTYDLQLAELALGAHTVLFTATDNAGNTQTQAATFTVADQTKPTITVNSPAASGNTQPMLDVNFADDKSGVDLETASVTVNGVAVAVNPTTNHLQVSLGTLVSGVHTIVVTIRDNAGNETVAQIDYTADAGDGSPAAPGKTGLYMINTIDKVVGSATVHIIAVAAKDGRPITGRVELRKGDRIIAGKDLGANGVVDIQATISEAGPMTLVPPPGSGLAPIDVTYEYVTPDRGGVDCTRFPNDPTCQSAGGGTGSGSTDQSGNGAGSGAAQPGASNGPGGGPAVPASCTASSTATCPQGVVYYLTIGGKLQAFYNGVPLGESGSKYDKQAPQWTMTLVQQKKGTVKRTRRIKVVMWTNEAAFLKLTPTGAGKLTLVSQRRVKRTTYITVSKTSKLGKQLAKARPGQLVKVTLTIIAADMNNNAAKSKPVVFKVRA